MDSEHRHELKENELFEFFHHFNEWWSKNGTSTLVTILIAVAAVVGWKWYSGREQRSLEKAWSAYAAALSYDSLQQVAQQHADEPGVSNYAMLKAADQLLFTTVMGNVDTPGIDPTTTTLTDVQKNDLEKAIGIYEQVLQLEPPSEPSLHVLNARMGIAACYETLREFDKAREQYQQIQQQAGVYKAHAQLATSRLEELDGLAEPIVFHPGPVTAEGEEAPAPPEGAAEAPGETTEPAVTPSP